MAIDDRQVQKLADIVQDAQQGRYEIDKLTKALCPQLTIADAYLVQQELVRRRVAAGDAVAGPKMGLTSLAKLRQMHVEDPVYGFVFRSMLVENGGRLRLSRYIHPKAEPEIGLVLAQDLQGPGVGITEVLQKVESVFPAIEIIDSRYKNFDFTLPDVIADNTSAAAAVYGPRIPLKAGMDLAAVEVTFAVNGRKKAAGNGAAVLGHPASSVVRLANMLAAKGQKVPAGQPILTGAVTAAVMLAAGDVVQAEFSHDLGRVGFTADG